MHYPNCFWFDSAAGWRLFYPAPGDKLWLPLERVRHYLIFTGYDAEGWPMGVQSTRKYGVCEERLPVDVPFFYECPIAEAFANEQIVARARSLIGRPWHLVVANCEQFANWSQTGYRISYQVNNVAFWLAVGGLVLMGATAESRPRRRRSA